MRLTLVTGSFSADHQRPFGDHRHGHDWHIEALVPDGEHKDRPQDNLDSLLDKLDHSFLDEYLEDPSNEGVAEWIGARLGAVEVTVLRFDRGRRFGGVWRA